VFLAVTVALGTTEPDASWTRPEISWLVVVWPKRAATQNSSGAGNKNRFIRSPLNVKIDPNNRFRSAWQQYTPKKGGMEAELDAGFEWHHQGLGDIMALAVVSGCILDADGTLPRSLGPDVDLLSV
jgi:hypothetical protein